MNENLFDLSEEYDAMLHRGLQFSGEDKNFFIKGRIKDLQNQLSLNYQPSRILDFGCGLGDTTAWLAQKFPKAIIVGIDTAESALVYARKTYGSGRIIFDSIETLVENEPFDLCYVNGVLHHILPEERRVALQLICQVLRPGGYFSLFENNPWNPGTQLVMKHIPFDRAAKTLTPRETRHLLEQCGFECLFTRFLFYFPHWLAYLRFSELWLAKLPLGAQYYVFAVKR